MNIFNANGKLDEPVGAVQQDPLPAGRRIGKTASQIAGAIQQLAVSAVPYAYHHSTEEEAASEHKCDDVIIGESFFHHRSVLGHIDMIGLRVLECRICGKKSTGLKVQPIR